MCVCVCVVNYVCPYAGTSNTNMHRGGCQQIKKLQQQQQKINKVKKNFLGKCPPVLLFRKVPTVGSGKKNSHIQIITLAMRIKSADRLQ